MLHNEKRDLEQLSSLNLIRYQKLDGGAYATVALTLGDTASGHTQAHVHKGLEHHSVSGPGKGSLYWNTAICVDLGVHEKVDRMDDRPLLLQAGVDVAQAIGMPLAIVIEEIIHFRPAAWVQ